VARPVEPSVVERAVLDRARCLWHSGPYHPLCLELGFASWEGLWSDFSGCHGRVDRLRGKPSATVFGLALAALGVPATAAVMVGDSWECDVQGSAGVGASAVWVRGDRGDPQGSAVPSVSAVGELAPWLEAMEGP
jgi:phosphoglycolate phosphatase-like HAD superfamily hydrolase